jgi:hypothetical protein
MCFVLEDSSVAALNSFIGDTAASSSLANSLHQLETVCVRGHCSDPERSRKWYRYQRGSGRCKLQRSCYASARFNRCGSESARNEGRRSSRQPDTEHEGWLLAGEHRNPERDCSRRWRVRRKEKQQLAGSPRRCVPMPGR